MKGISNTNTMNILLNSNFNYHSHHPKSTLKHKSSLLKQSNSTSFDLLSDSELR